MTGMRNAPRTVLSGLFVTYLLLLVWIVLWKFEVPSVGGVNRVIKLVPFVASGGEGASDPLEVAANLLLFVPFGAYLGLLAPSWTWWKATAVMAGASAALEVTQYVLAVGSSDLTDVIVNTAGGVAAFGIVAWARGRRHGRVVVAIARVCSVGTVLAVLASALLFASPLRLGPPADGRVLHAPEHGLDAGRQELPRR